MKPWTWSCPSSPGKLSSAAATGRDATSARADTARTKRIPATRSFQAEKIAVCPNSVSPRLCPPASFQCRVNAVLMTPKWQGLRRELRWTGSLYVFSLHPQCLRVETQAKVLAKDCQGAEPLPE